MMTSQSQQHGEPVIALLSGGLDSAVSLVKLEADPRYHVLRAVMIDYGQRAFLQERKASSSLAQYYGIPYQVLTLDWLKEVLPEGLKSESDIDNPTEIYHVWVPNRNGLFLNIAAAMAEAYGAKYVSFGANVDEAQAGFPDNGVPFYESMNETLKYSTLNGVQVMAPVGDLTKIEIAQLGKTLALPFKYVWSCYEAGDVHCGKCASCQHLKRAVKAVGLAIPFADDTPAPVATL